MVGNKGRRQFCLIPAQLSRWTVSHSKNDFFEWYESDGAVYVKPDQRLIFQEVSSSDASLWNTFIDEVIRHRPRKPFQVAYSLLISNS